MLLRKFLVFFLGFFLAIGLLPNGALAASEVDQSNITSTSDGSLVIYNHQRIAQTFRPSKSKLDKVAVHIYLAAGTLDVTIMKDPGEANESIVATVMGQTIVEGWNEFDFADIDITVGGRYGIYLFTANPQPAWYYTGNNYANGFAIASSTNDFTKDFGFKTYGYDPEGATTTTTASGTTTTTALTQTGVDTSANVGAAPAATTSASIKAPTSIKAENSPVNNKPAVKITWKASTTSDIDGYKVFRKEGKGSYKQVAQTKKTVSQFIDEKVKEETEYTYMVRTYKGSSESANSNEATIKVAKVSTTTTKVQKPVGEVPVITYPSWTDPQVLAFLILAALSAVGFTVWFIIDYRKRKRQGL
jgi:hypothetical protein